MNIRASVSMATMSGINTFKGRRTCALWCTGSQHWYPPGRQQHPVPFGADPRVTAAPSPQVKPRRESGNSAALFKSLTPDPHSARAQHKPPALISALIGRGSRTGTSRREHARPVSPGDSPAWPRVPPRQRIIDPSARPKSVLGVPASGMRAPVASLRGSGPALIGVHRWCSL